MANIELRNGTDMKFVDVSSETLRRYFFPGGEVVAIDDPQFLHVSRSGHRVLDGRGFSHYIPKGWIHLEWKVADGEPHFVA